MTGPAAISSLDNPKVKDAVRLRERRARRRTGLFLVEGRRELVLALEAGLAPQRLFVERARLAAGPDDPFPAGPWVAERAAERGAAVVDVTPAVWEKIAIREESGGLLGVFRTPDVSFDRLSLRARPLVLAASGVEKPGNLGALLRSADAFGVDALVVEGGTDLFNPNVVRASLGCLFTVPLAAVPAGSLFDALRGAGLSLVAATPDGARTPDAVDLTGAVALVVGSEEAGLGRERIATADERVRIPLRGRADSLNVSVSAGILLYEADRQRNRP